jgi:hypothetical protein
MFKTYKNFILLFIIIISILLFFLKKYNDILAQDQIDILVSKNVEIITNEISNQKRHALSLAILLAQNHDIITLLQNNKRKELQKELNTILKTISSYTDIKNIQIQVHTKELKVFVRNWEDKDTGLELESFRKGLVKVKQTKQPYVSNELGKRLNIKAIAPIFDQNKNYIGSIEVITNYQELQKRLELIDIKIMPLLNKKFLNIAKYHQNNKELHQYILIAKEYDQKLYDILNNNPTLLSTKTFYHQFGDNIITMIPLGNFNNESAGYIVAFFNVEDQNFNYLPQYEYSGDISTDFEHKAPQENLPKRNIIIK